MLKDFLWSVNNGTIDLAFRGFFNVEGGAVEASTGLYPQCDECDSVFLSEIVWKCDSCGRSSETTVTAKSGDGDGVYTAWAVRYREEEKLIGIFSVFDSDYSLASVCRGYLEQEEGSVPDFEPEILTLIGLSPELKRVTRGALRGDGGLHIGGSPFGIGMRQPFVNFYISGEKFVISFFVEEPGKHSGSYNNDLEHKIRAILLLNSEYLTLAGPEEIAGTLIDWVEEEKNNLMVMVASHLEPMTETIPPMNFLTHYALIDRSQPLIVDDDLDLEKAASWALFEYLVNGNENLVDLMIEEKWDFSQSDVQEILDSRGLLESAESLELGLLGFGRQSSSPSDLHGKSGSMSASTGLSKSQSGGLSKSGTGGNGLGSGQNSSEGEAKVLPTLTHRFCFECGWELPGPVKFCSSCGQKLH